MHCDIGHKEKWCKLYLVLKLDSGFYLVYGKTVKTDSVCCIRSINLLNGILSLLGSDVFPVIMVTVNELVHDTLTGTSLKCNQICS